MYYAIELKESDINDHTLNVFINIKFKQAKLC